MISRPNGDFGRPQAGRNQYSSRMGFRPCWHVALRATCEHRACMAKPRGSHIMSKSLRTEAAAGRHAAGLRRLLGSTCGASSQLRRR